MVILNIDKTNKNNSFPKNYYLHNCYISLIRSNIIYILLIIIEVSLTLTQEVDIYFRSYRHRTTVKGNKSISLNLLLIISLDKLSVNQKMYLLIIPIIVLDIAYFFYRYYKVERSNYVSIIIINILELIFFRMYVLFYLNLLFSLPVFHLYALFFFNFYHCYIVISNFMNHHLFKYVPKFINYPYDEFSAIFDSFHFICKFLVSISTMALDVALSKFCFVVLFILEACFAAFYSYIAFYKCYLLMINPLHNKIRYSLALSMFVIPLVLVFTSINKITIIILFILFIVLIILFLILILYLYDPFKQVQFKPINYDENIYYYLFLKENNKFSDFSLENKIIEHINRCRKCFFCKKCSENNMKIEEDSKNYNKDNDLFNLLLNRNNDYLVLMNFIVYDYLNNGIESLYNNPYYHIYLLYYYFKNLENHDYNLALNELLILDIINNGNKVLIEGNKSSIDQLLLVNEFLTSAKHIITDMEDILFSLKGKEKVKKIITLSETIKDLNSKKFYKILLGHKIESNINNSQLIFICSIIYEEIFNTELTNSHIPLRDNLQSLEDIFNYSFKNNKNISLKVNLTNFNCTILRAGKELIKYINTNLYNLFPSNFRIHQVTLFQNEILSLKHIKKNLLKKNKNIDTYTSNHSNLKKKNYNLTQVSKSNENSFNMFLIIESRIDKSIYYKILRMKLFLLYNDELNDFIILNGIYRIEKNSIITTFKKNCNNGLEEEIIFGVSNDILLSNNPGDKINISQISKSLIFLKNSLKLKNYNLKLLQVYEIGITKYNIYFLHEKRKNLENSTKIYKIPQKQLLQSETNNIQLTDYDDNEIEFENNKKTFELEDTGSVGSQQVSTSNDRSSNSGGLSKTKNRKGTKNIVSYERIFKVQKFIFIFIVLLVSFTIFYLVNFKVTKEKIRLINSSFSLFRNFCRYYYLLISAIPCLICIPQNKTKNECENYINIFNKEYSNIYPEENFNFSTFIIEKNKITIDILIEAKQDIFTLSKTLGDKKFEEFFTEKHIYLGINKIEENKNNISLEIAIQPLDFIDVLSLIGNSFQIFAKSESNILQKPIFLLTYHGNPFGFLAGNNRDLSEFQMTTYRILLNCLDTFQHLSSINTQFSDLYSKKTKMLSTNFYIFHHLNIFIILVIIMLLFYYVNTINELVKKIINYIDNKISYKSPQFDFSQLFSQKLEKLNILLTIYTKDPINILSELNDVYSNYSRYTSELKKIKNKEKKNITIQENEEDEEDNLLIKKNKLATSNILHQIGSDIFYRNYLTFIVIITIILYFYIIITSALCFYNSSILHSFIKMNIKVEGSIYKSFNYFQQFILQGLSIEEMSERIGTKDILDSFSNDLANVFLLQKERKKIKSGIKNFDDYASFNCENLYNNYKYRVLEILYKKYPEKNYKQKLIKLCEYSNITIKGLDMETISDKFFQDIINGMMSVEDETYESRVKVIFSDTISKFGMFFNSIIIFIIRMTINQEKEDIAEYILNSFDALLTKITLSYVVYVVIILMILILVYIKKVNNYLLQIFRLKKIFKICNSQER